MAKCDNCGERFSVDATRNDYNSLDDIEGMEDAWGNTLTGDYDTDHHGQLCFDCAIPDDVAGAINHGQAILMMSGDEDYDAEHVEKHL